MDAVWEGDRAQFDAAILGGAKPSEATPKERWNYLHRALIMPRRSATTA
jgi:hypothetical protein